jgi:hypothetical protein
MKRNDGMVEMSMIKIGARLLIGGILTMSVCANAQLKTDQEQEVTASQSMLRPVTSIGSFLGLLNSDNFMMHHNLSFSYLSYGGGALSVASYTKSMFYKIADPLNVRVDLTLQGSPFGQNAGFAAGDMNKLFISRAELKYQPWDNTSIRLEYNQLPIGYYGRYSPFSGLSPYLGDQ